MSVPAQEGLTHKYDGKWSDLGSPSCRICVSAGIRQHGKPWGSTSLGTLPGASLAPAFSAGKD